MAAVNIYWKALFHCMHVIRTRMW